MKSVAEIVLQNKMQHEKCDGMPMKTAKRNTVVTNLQYLGCTCCACETFSWRKISIFLYFFSKKSTKTP